MRKYNRFNSITYCGGNTQRSPDLYIPINQSNLGISGIDKESNVVSTSYIPSAGLYPDSGNLVNNFYLGNTSYILLSKGNAVVNDNHSGNCIYFDGISQYVYAVDSTGELNNSLDVGLDDFMVSFWFTLASIPTSSKVLIGKRYGIPTGGYGYHIGFVAGGSFFAGMMNPTTGISVYSPTILKVGKLYFVSVLFNRSGSGYFFINGTCDKETSISTFTDNIDNTHNFYIGAFQSGNYTNGYVKDVRLFRFGVNGLTVVGTKATNDLLIKCKNEVIYDQTGSRNLIYSMYKSPYSSVEDLGYKRIANARRDEMLKSFYESSKWGLWNEGGSTTSWKVSSVSGTAMLNFDGKQHNLLQSQTDRNYTGETNKYYELRYEVIENTTDTGALWTGSDFYYGTSEISQAEAIIPSTVGEQKILLRGGFKITTYPFYFIGRGGTTGTIVISGASIRRIGEVCRYQFDSNIQSNVAVNGGFEYWISDVNLTNWTEANYSAGVRDVTKESTVVKEGNYSVKLSTTGNNGVTDLYLHQDVTLDTNYCYELSGYIYFPVRTNATVYLTVKTSTYGTYTNGSAANLTSTNGDWIYYSTVFKPTQADNKIICGLDNGTITDIAYFDSVSLKRISVHLDSGPNNLHLLPSNLTSSSYPSCSIGTTNDFVNINKQSGTVSFWFKSLWDSNDNKTHYLFLDKIEDGSGNSSVISIKKDSDNHFYFSVYPSQYDIHYAEKDVSQPASGTGFYADTWNHVVAVWSSGLEDKIFSTKLFFNNELYASGTSLEVFGSPDITSFSDPLIGASGTDILDCQISNFIMDSDCWKRTISEARTVNMSDWKSVEYAYNNGIGNKPICDFNTKVMLVNT